ncbi:MAG: carotenoid biosynthesis protein [Candidatus Methanodesulfokora sp.]|jgi:putative membrane protein
MNWKKISTALLATGYVLNAVMPSIGARGPADLALLMSFILSVLFMLPFSKKIVLLPFLGSSIGFLFEYIGVNYGYPFGGYSYLKLERFSLYGVPIPIIIAWGIYVYTCYLASSYIIKGRGRIFVASLLMVLLDMAVDPVMVENGIWAWREGGIWFGIPLTNFFGWYTVSIMAFFLYSIFSREDLDKSLSWHAYIPYLFSFLPILASAGRKSWIPAYISFLIAVAVFYAGKSHQKVIKGLLLAP